MRGARLFAGLADDSLGEDSSEASTDFRQRAKTLKRPLPARWSNTDRIVSQLMDRLAEMDRHQAARDAREVAHHHSHSISDHISSSHIRLIRCLAHRTSQLQQRTSCLGMHE